MTRSQKLALFIEHHSFVSCFEPTKVEEALKDPDWINAMHEELNNFTCNEVWTLKERPQGAICLVDLLCLGPPRNKIVWLCPPPK